MSVLKSTVIASLLIPAAFVTAASPAFAQGAPGAASQAATSRAKPAPQYQYLRLVEGFDPDEGKAFLFIDGKR